MAKYCFTVSVCLVMIQIIDLSDQNFLSFCAILVGDLASDKSISHKHSLLWNLAD
jgi:hypothetical protein